MKILVIGDGTSRWTLTHSNDFANGFVRLVPDFTCTIPFSRGVHEIVAWYGADPARQKVDPKMNVLIDQIIAADESAFPGDWNGKS